MRRTAPGVAAVLSTLLLAPALLTGCGNDAGAAAAGPDASAPDAPPSAPPASAPSSSLAPLAVLPAGYLAADGSDPRNLTGPFTAQKYLSTLSPVPPEDRALLLNAGFVEGYQASRTSPDRRKKYTLQLFKTASNGKAKRLQQGFWEQENRRNSFQVPGVPEAFSDARVVATGIGERSEAIAEVSYVIGSLVVELSVEQIAPASTNPRPDTALVAALAKQQRTALTRKSS